ncbi:hypothetical protein GCM10017044_16370 [Kordiimonas sediminis]|uniref:PepSY domain-containing protein n=1 Tax=Kordiimonas sediminis TaxID=1735581 RepID=A0A919ATY2_9PROT|nr:PepSY domain-containing protein [Kordiimonas sediminis]GHF22735.1 hypothetical protein GCM10017044_16370 [Kordiimonas sediminis]
MLKVLSIFGLVLIAVVAQPDVLRGGVFTAVQASDDHNDALAAIKRGEILPYSKIRRIVQKKMGGKIIGERLRRTNRGWVYELRIRGDKGKILFAIVDARTGKILNR